MKSFGSLTVKATLDGYDFETSTFDSIGPDSSATLTSTPIVPKRYRLSGKVDRSSLPPELEIKVKFGGEGEVLVNDKGSFSLYLPGKLSLNKFCDLYIISIMSLRSRSEQRAVVASII